MLNLFIILVLHKIDCVFNSAAKFFAFLLLTTIPPIEAPAPSIPPAKAPQGSPIVAPVEAPCKVELIVFPIC